MRRRRLVSRAAASPRPSLPERVAVVERRQDLSERYFERRLADLDRFVDREINLEQARTGQRQLGVARIAIAMSALLFVVGMLTTYVLVRIH